MEENKTTTTQLIANSLIRARYVQAGNSKDFLFVTFCPWRQVPNVNDSGWGESYLLRHKIDACHIVTSRNDWFHNDSMINVIEKINIISRDYKNVVTYGSSMGGYGAINFSALLNANIVLSIAPQYSIIRSKVPFEPRWSEEEKFIRFGDEYIHNSGNRPCDTFVLYDQFHSGDFNHVRLISGARQIIEVRLPFIGHDGVPPSIAKTAVESILKNCGADLKKSVQAKYRSIKKDVANYYFFMATQNRHLSAARKIDLLKKCLELKPDHINAPRYLATNLIASSRLTEAINALETQISIRPADGDLYYQLYRAYELKKDYKQARAACERAALRTPLGSWVWNSLAYLCIIEKEYALALGYQNLALKIHPDNASYFGQKARIMERLGRYEEACAAGKYSVEFDPDNALNWHWYAVSLHSAGRSGEALEAARRSASLNDAFLEYYCTMFASVV